MLEYRDVKKALRSAKAYGWTEKNRLHFSRFVIVQPDKDPQYETCPECKKLTKRMPDICIYWHKQTSIGKSRHVGPMPGTTLMQIAEANFSHDGN